MKESVSAGGVWQTQRKPTGRVRRRAALRSAAAQGFTTLRLLGLVTVAAASILGVANLHAANAAALLGERGDLDQIEFEGVTTFAPEALRNALAQNATFLLASHTQAPLDAFLKTLREKILTGYEANGFPDVKVTAALDPAMGRVRVSVTEGTRYRCGKVQVTGTKSRLAAAIRARLTQPPEVPSKLAENVKSSGAGDGENKLAKALLQAREVFKLDRHDPREALAAKHKPAEEEPLWPSGQPGAFGDASAENIKEAVKDCLAERGFFFPRISSSVKLDPKTATAELLVQVLDEGPRGAVSEIEVTGNQKNTRGELLHFLGLERGMAITRSKVAQAEEKLLRSARFLDYEIKPEPVTSGLTKATSVKLALKVHEYEAAPKLSEPFSAEQQVLLRFCDWLSGFNTRRQDLELTWTLRRPSIYLNMRGDLIISPRQGAVLAIKDPDGAGTLDYTLLLGRQTIGLFAPRSGTKLFASKPNFCSEGSIAFNSNSTDPEHRFHAGVGLGFNSKPDKDHKEAATPTFRLSLDLAPVAFLHFLDATNLVTRTEGKTLALLSSNLVLRVEVPTGRLKELMLSDSAGSLEVHLAEGAFDQERRRLDAATAGLSNAFIPGYPLSSLVSFAAAEVARSRLFDKVATNLPPVQRQRAIAAVSKLLGTTVLAPLDRVMSTNRQAERFSIPADETDRALAQNSLSAFFAAFGFRYCNEFFPKYSWPWTIARESVFVLAHQGIYADAELKRLYQSEDTGPVGCLLIAEVLARMNSPAARTFAIGGLVRLSAADFRHDCRLLLQGNSGLARAVSNMMKTLRDMPSEEVNALAAALPSAEAGLLKDCAQALRSAPTQPLPENLAPALNAYWEKSLRAQVRGALLKLSTAAAGPARPRI